MWRQPKTDWTSEDFFNLEDYIRIKENLEYLQGYAYHLFPTIEITNMRSLAIRTDLPRAYDFNRFESNLEKLNLGTFRIQIGDTIEYSPNGITIDADEVNRIESASLELYRLLHLRGDSLNRMKFRLGMKGGIGLYNTHIGDTMEQNKYTDLETRAHEFLETLNYALD